MGRSKAMLPHADGVTTFLAHAIATCQAGGAQSVVVVGREGDEAVRAEAERFEAAFVINPDPERGQLSSLLTGLAAAERIAAPDAILVLPVDVPLITPDGVRRLLDRADATAQPIVRPAAGACHGHPVIFKRVLFPELRAADPAAGARAVVRADPARVAEVDMGDPATLADVDTPDDYRRAFGRPV